MKHLLCEHQNTISELRANALVSTEMQQKEQDTLETELQKRMKAIKVEMEEIDDENLVKELELVCNKHQVYMVSKLYHEWIQFFTFTSMYFLQIAVWLLSWQKHAEETTEVKDKLEQQLRGKLEWQSAERIPPPRPNSHLIFNQAALHCTGCRYQSP